MKRTSYAAVASTGLLALGLLAAPAVAPAVASAADHGSRETSSRSATAATAIADRPDGAKMYKSGSGNLYARESNHWDVLYYNCGGC
ncbi:hypothetical protein HUT18_20515 [Streptomyces sp. NA04227]|uniref:hypothetical protein n=1 Tax=Streptomyces sp. NA04227 TaxID=2742136 RepID=UPI001591FF43|nr:hypothetical protein [Streptomyces sp. NA04227]QKW04967.1 hypothetical protein HUT18_20515 [Streptomyces sp. NA04227]